jgi:putative ABC transport system permease protein
MLQFWYLIKLAARNLARHPRRSSVAVLAIAAGIAALLLASGFIEWNLDHFREATIHSQLGHLQIVRPGYHEAGTSAPLRYLLPPNRELFDRLSAQDGIVTVAPRLAFSGMASHGETTVSFIGEAVDPRREVAFNSGLTITDGTALSADDNMGALLGQGLAVSLGAKVGEHIVLLVNRPNGSIKAVELTVRGHFSSALKAYDDVALRIPITTAEQLLGINGAHVWLVLLAQTNQTDPIAERIRTMLPKTDFEVVPWYRLADFYKKSAALFAKQVFVEKLIIAVIIVLSISNIMTMSVIERTSEIGTIMALGTKRRHVIAMFIFEGALLGVVGGLLGLLLGSGSAALISRIGIPMPPPPGMPSGYTAQILVTYQSALEALILAIGTTLLASLYPAWKASRQVIVEALRHNR